MALLVGAVHAANWSDGLPVADRVSPWMLTALLPHNGTGFDWLARCVAFTFCFVFAPATIFAAGYRYLRAHEMAMTTYHALLAAIAIVSAWRFAVECFRVNEAAPVRIGGALRMAMTAGVVAVFLTFCAYGLTHGSWKPPGWLVALSPHAQLFRAELSRKPEGGWEREVLEVEQRIAFLKDWECKPEDDACAFADKDPGGPDLTALKHQLRNRLSEVTPAALGLQEATAGLNPDFHYPAPVGSQFSRDQDGRIAPPRDLRGAELRQAHLAKAELRCATLIDADLRRADLRLADLRGARMEGADFIYAQMAEADLSYAPLEGAILLFAQMEGASLWSAHLEGAHFGWTNMEGANLRNAQMEKANLFNAHLEEANLGFAHLEGADLSGASLWGAGLREINLTGVIGFTREQALTAFGDASVVMSCVTPAPEDGEDCQRMGHPAHWPNVILSYDAYSRRLRGWREHLGRNPEETPGGFGDSDTGAGYSGRLDGRPPIPPSTPIAPGEIAR